MIKVGVYVLLMWLPGTVADKEAPPAYLHGVYEGNDGGKERCENEALDVKARYKGSSMYECKLMEVKE